MTKIRFFSNYLDSQSLLGNYFMASLRNREQRFQYSIGNDYDIAVIFNRTDEAVLTSAFKVVMVQEPSWSPHLLHNKFFVENDLLFVHDASLFPNARNIIEHPTVINYYDELPLDFFLSKKPNKRRKLSMIISGANFCRGHEMRLKLLDKILKSDLDIDIFGRDHNNITDKRFKGSTPYKYHGLADYEYSICVENTQERNYVTEKFIDALMCHTIPIYFGAPNINEIYYPGGYQLISLDDDLIIDRLKEIIYSDQCERRHYCNLNMQKYLNCYNIESVLTAVL